jgi:hypothetical protein
LDQEPVVGGTSPEEARVGRNVANLCGAVGHPGTLSRFDNAQEAA